MVDVRCILITHQWIYLLYTVLYLSSVSYYSIIIQTTWYKVFMHGFLALSSVQWLYLSCIYYVLRKLWPDKERLYNFIGTVIWFSTSKVRRIQNGVLAKDLSLSKDKNIITIWFKTSFPWIKIIILLFNLTGGVFLWGVRH